MTGRQAFVPELRKQFAYAGSPLVILPEDIKADGDTADRWRARVKLKLPYGKTRDVLLTSHHSVSDCLRGFSLEWASQFHVVIHAHTVDGQQTVG